MEKKQLLASLQNLHDELAGTDHVDAETLKVLQTITDDITRIVSSEKQEAEAEDESISGRWQELLLQFEADHPHLVAAFQRITTGLANLGI